MTPLNNGQFPLGQVVAGRVRINPEFGALAGKSRPGPRLREPGRRDGRCTLISRILSPPSAGNDHLSSSRAKGPVGADQSRPRLLPGNIPLTRNRAGNPFSLFCLAPHGVCLAPSVTLRAVGSYPAISPLPTPAKPEWAVSFLRHFPSTVTFAPAARTFMRQCCLMVSGLSSLPAKGKAVVSGTSTRSIGGKTSFSTRDLHGKMKIFPPD